MPAGHGKTTYQGHWCSTALIVARVLEVEFATDALPASLHLRTNICPSHMATQSQQSGKMPKQQPTLLLILVENRREEQQPRRKEAALRRKAEEQAKRQRAE